jgi:hexosaminidase
MTRRDRESERLFPLRPGVAAIVAAGLVACAGAGGGPSGDAAFGPATPPLPLVPIPASIAVDPGAVSLPSRPAVRLPEGSSAPVGKIAEDLAESIRSRTGRTARVIDGEEPATGPEIRLLLEGPAAAPDGDPFARDEGYGLVIDANGIEIRARTPAGLFYGTRTFLQLLPARAVGPGEPVTLPRVRIEDAPRFGYRGLHLDVGRHWFPVEFVKRYIDLMAAYKLNAFHWHLTEDQGWRLEIRSRPLLTEVGSRRRETILGKNFDPYVGDGVPYGGYYTRDEVREVVAYAAERFVTVIPEIEMPGHSVAALAAYPELACTDGPFEVATTWGVHEDIFCPSEETFAFLEDVLSEVIELFPSPLIHIGGDEAPKARWIESPVAQEVIRREGLADEAELQSWFLRRIEAFVEQRGRRIVGWDEILEGGLPPDAVVMSWRGVGGGVEAARLGHDVIMTPTSHAYFDYYQGDPAVEPPAIGGFLPLERVYGFEPVPDGLPPRAEAHVLGAQGNVWTEYLETPDAVEYMAFPRALALAEVTWSPRAARSWDGFLARLGPRLAELEARGVRFRVPDVGGLEENVLTLDDRVRVPLANPIASGEIRFTLDGSAPVRSSPRYEAPLSLVVDEAGTTVTARLFLPGGRVGPPRSARFSRAVPRPAEEGPVGTATGLDATVFEGAFRSVSEIDAAKSVGRRRVDAVGIPPGVPDEGFGLRLDGWLVVPETGVYTFRLTSDDGSDLRIGDRDVVVHDGLHGAEEKSGPVALEAGAHRLRIRMFQAGGGRALSLSVRPPGSDAAVPVPPEWLRRVDP